jgi:hypothetical protein
MMVGKHGELNHAARGHRILALAVVLFLLMGPFPAMAFPLWGDASVGVTVYHQMSVIQGDDTDTVGVEPRARISVVDRTVWSVPWTSSEIYTYIPPGASNVSVDNIKTFSHQGSTFFMPGDFSTLHNPDDPPAKGWMDGSAYEGYYYWRFPEQADRDKVQDLGFDTTADFQDADPEFTDLEQWNVTDGMLSLSSNTSSATYVSKRYVGGVDIVRVNTTVGPIDAQNVTIEISADNGTSWHTVSNGTSTVMSGTGAEFRWRASMSQNVSGNDTPSLDRISFNIRFTPEFNDIWIETTYFLDIEGRELEFDMIFPFDSTASTLVLIALFDDDMDLQVNGTEMVKTDAPSGNGRVTYSHRTGGHDQILTLIVTDYAADDGEGGDSSLFIYIFITMLVVIMVIAAAMTLSRGKGGTERTSGISSGTSEDSDEDAMTARKTDLFKQIKDLDEDHRVGLIEEDEYQRRRRALKAEVVELMRQMDKSDKH